MELLQLRLVRGQRTKGLRACLLLIQNFPAEDEPLHSRHLGGGGCCVSTLSEGLIGRGFCRCRHRTALAQFDCRQNALPLDRFQLARECCRLRICHVICGLRCLRSLPLNLPSQRLKRSSLLCGGSTCGRLPPISLLQLPLPLAQCALCSLGCSSCLLLGLLQCASGNSAGCSMSQLLGVSHLLGDGGRCRCCSLSSPQRCLRRGRGGKPNGSLST